MKNIIFDLGGVILNIDYLRTSKAFKELGHANFDDLYTQASQTPLFNLFETGKISEVNFFGQLAAELHSTCSLDELKNAWNAMLLGLPVERMEKLNELNKTHSIFLLSNTNETHVKAFQKIVEQQYGYAQFLSTFHTTYYSNEIGMRKPDAEVFEFVLDQHNLKPEDTLFIDDSIQHIKGAQQCGLHTHHLTPSETILDLF